MLKSETMIIRPYRRIFRQVMLLSAVILMTALPARGAIDVASLVCGVGSSVQVLMQAGRVAARIWDRGTAGGVLPGAAGDSVVEANPLKKKSPAELKLAPEPVYGSVKNVRLIIGAVGVLFLAGLTCYSIFVWVRCSRNPSAARRCRHCGYAGQMKLKILHKSSRRNIILLVMAGVLPAMVYIISEQIKFRCPRCRRSGENVALNDGN